MCVSTGGLQYRETRLRLSHNLIPTRTARPSHVSLMPHVEVGSGCGLLGIFAAKLGATVALTDQPYVLPNLERNVNLNLGSFLYCISYTFAIP